MKEQGCRQYAIIPASKQGMIKMRKDRIISRRHFIKFSRTAAEMAFLSACKKNMELIVQTLTPDAAAGTPTPTATNTPPRRRSGRACPCPCHPHPNPHPNTNPHPDSHQPARLPPAAARRHHRPAADRQQEPMQIHKRAAPTSSKISPAQHPKNPHRDPLTLQKGDISTLRYHMILIFS